MTAWSSWTMSTTKQKSTELILSIFSKEIYSTTTLRFTLAPSSIVDDRVVDCEGWFSELCPIYCRSLTLALARLSCMYIRLKDYFAADKRRYIQMANRPALERVYSAEIRRAVWKGLTVLSGGDFDTRQLASSSRAEPPALYALQLLFISRSRPSDRPIISALTMTYSLRL